MKWATAKLVDRHNRSTIISSATCIPPNHITTPAPNRSLEGFYHPERSFECTHRGKKYHHKVFVCATHRRHEVELYPPTIDCDPIHTLIGYTVVMWWLTQQSAKSISSRDLKGLDLLTIGPEHSGSNYGPIASTHWSDTDLLKAELVSNCGIDKRL